MRNRNYRKISIILYLISFVTPVFWGSYVPGAFALISGWMAVFEGHPFIGLPWIANLLYIISLLICRIKRHGLKIIISSLSVVFGFFLFGLDQYPIDEGGGSEKAVVGIGFYIWMASFVVLLLGYIRESKSE